MLSSRRLRRALCQCALLNAGGQDIPALSYYPTLSDIRPGGELVIAYANSSRTANIVPGKQYYSVTFHALYNVSAPFEPTTGRMTIPEDIEDKGMIMVSPEANFDSAKCRRLLSVRHVSLDSVQINLQHWGGWSHHIHAPLPHSCISTRRRQHHAFPCSSFCNLQSNAQRQDVGGQELAA